MKKNAWLKYGIILLIYLMLWQGLHMVTRSWLVPGPVQTVLALWKLVCSASFYGVVGSSVLRILAGLTLAMLVAILLTLLAFAHPFCRDLFQPFMLLAKSVPVACLAIVAILWFGSQGLVWFVVFLVAVPILYQQLLTALLACPVAWREMAHVYGFSRRVKIRTMALPLVQKPLRATLALIIGMSFKAGIAAEVIAVSQNSIGDRLYMSKVYFETDVLFAWIFVIMVLSYVTEKLLLFVYDGLMKKGLAAPKTKEERFNAKDFVPTQVQALSKAFGERTVVKDRTYSIDKPGVYAIVGASGSGKTTEMRILCGLETCDTGVIQKGVVSMAFQEVRLLEHLNCVDNLRIACRIAEREARHVAGNLLSPVLLQQPVTSLSGGERRRVEVLRALLAPVSLVLLDEPFAGLDEENTRCLTEMIRVTAEEKSIIISVHEPAEAVKLGAVIL